MEQSIFLLLNPIKQFPNSRNHHRCICHRLQNRIQLKPGRIPRQKRLIRRLLKQQLTGPRRAMQSLLCPLIQIQQMLPIPIVRRRNARLIKLRRRFALVQVMPQLGETHSGASFTFQTQRFVYCFHCVAATQLLHNQVFGIAEGEEDVAFNGEQQQTRLTILR